MTSTPVEFVQQFGQNDLIAYSTLQDGMARFETSFGFVAYRRVLGMDITLGGPICAPADQADLIRRFLTYSRRPIFCYIRHDTLQQLGDARLYCAGIGIDRHVDIATLLAVPARPVVGAVKKARKARLCITPLDLATVTPGTRRRLDAITTSYLASAEIGREMTFINRPMSFVADGMRRVYTLAKYDREHDGVFGYAVLNPIFHAGTVTAYLLDILRFEPTRLWGVWLSAVHELARQLASEGFGLSLGFCPLYRARPAPAGGSRLLQVQIDWMVRYLSSAQYLTRLRELKDLIPGPEEPRFLATFSPLAVVSLYAFMDAMGLGFGYLFGPDLIAVIKTGLRSRLSREVA